MGIEIPGGRFAPTPLALQFADDPRWAYAASCAAEGFNYLADGVDLEAEKPEMRVTLNDTTHSCTFKLLNISGRGLVLGIPFFRGETHYLYTREGLPSQPWLMAKYMLVLPADNPAAWGDEDDAFEERNWRVAQYAVQVERKKDWLR